MAVGDLGLQDARGAGAQEHADPRWTPARCGLAHAGLEAVGAQPEFGQPVVAAVEGGEMAIQVPTRAVSKSRCARPLRPACSAARVAARPVPSAVTTV
jgi:hypothetical protein